MLWRLAFPFVFFFAPRLIPRITRVAYLVWKLSLDSRVPLLLRLLVPATLVYFATPFSRFPYVGLAGYIPVLSLAIFFLLNLAPPRVVESHAPWRARQRTTHSSEKDPSRIVEGSSRLVDEEEPTK